MAIEFSAQLPLPDCRIKVILPGDFFHNCLTMDPYPHSHPKCELHYILRGSCTLVTDRTSLPCPQGHFVLLPSDCVHRLIPENPQAQSLSLLFSLDDVNGSALAPLNCQEIQILADTFLGQQRLLLIRQELTQRQAACNEIILGELTALFANLARALGTTKEPEVTPGEENRAEYIESYLAAHRFDPDSTCAALAKEMNLSTRQVHRLCMQYFGAPFRLLQNRIRMDIAAHRLRTTEISVCDLAEELGYASAASFSTAYKRHFGVAPSKDRG